MRNMQEEPQYIDKSLLLSVEPNDPLTEIPQETGFIVLTRPGQDELTNDYKKVETIWMRDIGIIKSCSTHGKKVVIKLNEPIHSLNQAAILALMRHRQTEGDSIRFEINPELPQDEFPEVKKVENTIKACTDSTIQ